MAKFNRRFSKKDRSDSLLLLKKCLKPIEYKIFSLRVFVLFKMSCNLPTLSVINKLSTMLKTSISLDTLKASNSLTNILLTHTQVFKIRVIYFISKIEFIQIV